MFFGNMADGIQKFQLTFFSGSLSGDCDPEYLIDFCAPKSDVDKLNGENERREQKKEMEVKKEVNVDTPQL